MNVFKQMMKSIIDAPQRREAYKELYNGFVGSQSIIQREINACNSTNITEEVFSASLSELMYEFSLITKRIHTYCIEFTDISDGRKDALKASLKSADRIIHYYYDIGSFRDLKTRDLALNKDWGIFQRIKESNMDLINLIDYPGKSSLYIYGEKLLLTADSINQLFIDVSNEK